MMILGRALLLRPSLGISSNRGAAFFTTRAALQSAFNGRVSTAGFRGGKFLGAVSIARPPAIVLQKTRSFAANPTTSSMTDPSPNWSNRPPKETILLEGCDYEHWLIVMEPPEGSPTRDEIIDSYIKTLSQVVGSEEEARMKIYSVSTKHYFAFGCLISEELSYKLKPMENVRWVLPDSYLDPRTKSYGGEPFINGQAVPYDPKYHEDWVRNNARCNERRSNDRPRNFDRSRNFERRREMQQQARQNYQRPPPPPSSAPPPSSTPADGNAQPIQAPFTQGR
jgi:hypothetical protein